MNQVPVSNIQTEVDFGIPTETEFRVQINLEYMEDILKQASENFGNMPTEEMYVTLKYIVNHMQTVFGFPEVIFEDKKEVIESVEGAKEEIADAALTV